jgi:hypothetical protein
MKARTGRAIQGCFRSRGNMWKLAFGEAEGVTRLVEPMGCHLEIQAGTWLMPCAVWRSQCSNTADFSGRQGHNLLDRCFGAL